MMPVSGTTQSMPLPTSELGMYVIDQQGGLSGWSNSMFAGEYVDAAVTGSLEVQGDCTGTLRISATPMGAPGPLPVEGVVRFIVLDNGNELRAMPVVGIVGAPVWLTSFRRLARNEIAGSKCSGDTIRGTYAVGNDFGNGAGFVTIPGQAQPVLLPVAGLGLLAVDRNGGVTGGFTQSLAGRLIESEIVDSTVEVFEDCTALFALRTRPKGSSGAPTAQPTIEKLVILENGEEIWTLTLSAPGAKPITQGSWRRISKDAGPVVW